jgi:hypothetical protein
MRKPTFLITYSFLLARLKQLLAQHLLAAPPAPASPSARAAAASGGTGAVPQPSINLGIIISRSQEHLVLTAGQMTDIMEGLWHIQPR